MTPTSSRLNQFTRWLAAPRYRRLKLTLILFLMLTAVYVLNQSFGYIRLLTDPRSHAFLQWAGGDTAVRSRLIVEQRDACPGAPFILPSDGYIGLLYADPRGPYSASRPHQGIDIFSEGKPGTSPVYAAYDGYITREPDWRSTLIQRIPDDPLQPGRQIWLYYTHMSDESGENDFIEPAFRPGTRELFVEQGTLLGYTGDYSGNPLRSVWTHLHFSIVLDDGNGRYRNELEIANTLDPSPYLGLDIHYQRAGAEIPTCIDGGTT